MANFLKGLFGGGGRSSTPGLGTRLIEAVSTYPVNPPPFPGARQSLTDKQRDANLAHLVATTAERLEALGRLLAGFALDVAPLLDSSAPAAGAASAIDDWLTNELPDYGDLPPSDAANAPYRAFEDSRRDGRDVWFTLVADLGLLEGEAIRRRDERFTWAVDRERGHRSLEMYRRPCLLKPAQEGWAATAIDFEFAMLSIIYERRRGTGVLHRFGDELANLARGAFDPSPTGFH